MNDDHVMTGELNFQSSAELAVISHVPAYAIQINGDDNKMLVCIKRDGTMLFGEHYHPDEAAQRFWDAISYAAPCSNHCSPESKVRSPYAVICRTHGQQFLSGEQYDAQMRRPDSYWECPVCGGHASWDDDNYEQYYENEQGEM